LWTGRQIVDPIFLGCLFLRQQLCRAEPNDRNQAKFKELDGEIKTLRNGASSIELEFAAIAQFAVAKTAKAAEYLDKSLKRHGVEQRTRDANFFAIFANFAQFAILNMRIRNRNRFFSAQFFANLKLLAICDFFAFCDSRRICDFSNWQRIANWAQIANATSQIAT
jgi:hypothetical protein